MPLTIGQPPRRARWICRTALAGLMAMSVPAAPASAAAPDDTDFLFRLGMLEGHLMVGHDLLAAGKPGLALPHFGHPVRELYDDISDYVAAHLSPAWHPLFQFPSHIRTLTFKRPMYRA